MKLIFFTYSLLISALTCFGQNAEKLIIHFGFNEFNIENKYNMQIDSIISGKTFEEINIEGYCDAVGSMGYNDSLSLKRAIEVKKYLISKNINEKLIKVYAYGESNPLVKNTNVSSPAFNRRAEIEFVLKPFDSLPKVDTIKKVVKNSLDIDSMEIGATFKLENINFYGGKHTFLPSSMNALEVLLSALKSHPKLEIEIQGHICCLSYGYDGKDIETGTMNLSVNRAKAVYDYLVENGIEPQRLSYKGFGSRNKLVDELTESDRIINRRVEIKVLKK